MNRFVRLSAVAVLLGGVILANLVLSGCRAPGGSTAGTNTTAQMQGIGRLAPNDKLTVVFSGATSPPDKFEGLITESGSISLPYIGDVKAAGKFPSELQQEIHDSYVTNYYKQLTVNVIADSRVFYVDGEVRSPNRYVYAGEMSVLKAIAAAGGLTDFANKKNIMLIRANGEQKTINYNRAKRKPELDLPIYPGDKVFVQRRYI